VFERSIVWQSVHQARWHRHVLGERAWLGESGFVVAGEAQVG
jgi:hypothetical protein